MSHGHRKICVLVSLLFVALAKRATAMVSVTPAGGTSFSQLPGTALQKGTRLVKADVWVTEHELNFAIATDTEGSLSLFHVYLDTDMDASTGYQPPSRKPEEMGADYLIEGGILHAWDGGNDHAAWKWKQIDSVNVERGAAGDIRVSVPLARLALRQPGRLRALVETLTDNWGSADTLPRTSVWEIDLTATEKSASTTPPAVPMPASPPRGLAGDGAVVAQAGNPAVDKAASLLQARADFDKGQLIVSIRTEGESNPGLYHVYIDTDLDPSTGFHPQAATEGLGGADFLVEGEFLYAWDGSADHAAWQWRKIGPVTVSRNGSGQFQVAIPLDKLNVSSGKRIQLLVETINDKWQGIDILPRKGVWRVDLPAGK